MCYTALVGHFLNARTFVPTDGSDMAQSDESRTAAATQSAARLRRGLAIAAVVLAALAAYLLHRPLKPDEAPPWNPLILGYTVVMLLPAAAFLLCAIVLGLIALSKTRGAMARRLRKFIVAVASSVACLVLLDIILAAFPMLQIDRPLFLPGSELQVPDAELGYMLKPGIRLSERFEPWRTGNLIMDGQVADPQDTGEVSEIELRTDADGFCNDGVPERCDIIVTGDSFVGQSPVQRDYYWATMAANKAGMSLYNLGVGGYGPQQELGVLKRHGLPKQPKIVLWAYFEGNDLRDAERFIEYQKSGLDWLAFNGTSNLRFPYTRPVVRLAVFLVRALGLASSGPKATPLPPYPKPYELNIGGAEYPMSFDRWTFRTLTQSRTRIENSPGWAATTATLLEAKRLCDESGATFAVVYLPDKFAVLADEALSRFEKDKEKIFRFARPALNENVLKKDDGTEITPEEFVEILRRNYGAQHEAVKEFCAKEGIVFIDTVPPLRKSVNPRGGSPYYSYDTHLNMGGEVTVADAVAEFLKSVAIPQVP